MTSGDTSSGRGNPPRRRRRIILAAGVLLLAVGLLLAYPLLADRSDARVAALLDEACPLRPAWVYEVLNKSLNWSPQRRCWEAILVDLVEMGPAAVPALVAALEDPEPEVRFRAAIVLLNTPAPAAVPALMACLDDKNETVRFVAASALGEIGDRRATAALLSALAAGDPNVVEPAIRSLGALGDPAAIPALVKVLEQDHYSGPLSACAAAALWGVGAPDVTPQLIKALADPNADRRCGPAQALGTWGEPRAIPALAAAFEESRRRAAQAAARFKEITENPRAGAKEGEEHDLSDLIGAEGRFREAVAGALGRINDPQGVPILLAAMQDDKKEVRHFAAWALGEIGDRRAAPALIEALGGNDVALRRCAAFALGALGDPALAAHLRPLLGDPDDEVRQRAAEGLALLGHLEAVAALAKAALADDAAFPYQSVAYLSRFDTPEAKQALREAAARAHRLAVRRLAARVLELGGPRALLAEAQEYGGGHPTAAADMLIYLADPSIRPALTDTQKSGKPYVRAGARLALRRMERHGQAAAPPLPTPAESRP